MQRAAPVASNTAKFQDGMSGPPRDGVVLGRLPSVKERSSRIVAAPSFDKQAMQSKHLRIVATCHELEVVNSRRAIPAELRGLRAQKERKRFLWKCAIGRFHESARSNWIA